LIIIQCGKPLSIDYETNKKLSPHSTLAINIGALRRGQFSPNKLYRIDAARAREAAH
jgi:hypothetical protein